jgi:hypothetical protein
MNPEYKLIGFYVMEPQKEFGKSTFTEFIYACHFISFGANSLYRLLAK